MKPYFDLDDLTTHRILGLITRCEELELENVCFIYHPKLKAELKFYMVKYANQWGLTVIQNWEKKRDIYKIEGTSFTFNYSEHD